MLMLKRRTISSTTTTTISCLRRSFSTVGSSGHHRDLPLSMPSLAHTLPSCHLPFPPFHADTNNNNCDGFRIRRGGVLGLRLSGCTGSDRNDVQRRARSFPLRRQLVRDPESPLLFVQEEEKKKSNSSRTTRDRLLNGGKPLGGGKIPDYSLANKIVVAVDVDEVLGNFVSALNRFIADHYAMNLSVSEYHVYEFFKIWNCSRDEADIRVHEFFKSPYFKTGIHPIPGAQKALHKLSRLCKLSVVTSRQNVIKDHTIEWIENHYPGLFQEIHFGNHFALDGESRSKSEICKSLGAKVLIDDNPKYAIECAEVGIKVLLFDYENSYPWCKTDSVNEHPLVTKVYNWEQVEQQLVSLIVSQSLVI